MIYVFKVVLLSALAYLGYLLFFRTYAHIVQRSVGVLLGFCLCVLIVFPDLSTRVAHFFGIGRGVDFLFYLAHIAALYAMAVLYMRQRAINQHLTEIVRSLALHDAEAPKQAPSAEDS